MIRSPMSVCMQDAKLISSITRLLLVPFILL